MIDVIRILERVGFKFGLDLDGHLEIEHPPALDLREFTIMLGRDHLCQLTQAIRFRAERQRRQCVGGPKNGARHTKIVGQPVLHHLARGRWAAYMVTFDGRAFYCGEASTKRQARHVAYTSPIYHAIEKAIRGEDS